MNNNLTQQDIANLAQEEKYRDQVEMMRKIYSPKGFFDYYFTQLPHHKTNIDCFNAANDLYFELFGDYKYSSHGSFLNQLKKHLEAK